MATAEADGQPNGTADERRPLLGDADQPNENDTTEQETLNNEDESSDATLTAEAPSTTQILLILGSIWIGVFFAALGG